MSIDYTKIRGNYHFNAEGIEVDSSPNSNDLTITGTTNPDGKLQEALFTDAIDDTVYNDSIIADLANDIVGGFPFWLDVDSLAVNQQQTVFSISNNGGAVLTEFVMFADTRVGVDKFIIILILDGTNQWVFEPSVALSSLNGFTQFAITHNAITPELYIDDSLDAVVFTTSTNKTKWMKSIITDAANKADRFAIGNLWRNGAVAQRGQIKIDEFIASGQHFTSEEVNEYNNGDMGKEIGGQSTPQSLKTPTPAPNPSVTPLEI